jgi:polyisoprenyl-phosphate glycosyltransferase
MPLLMVISVVIPVFNSQNTIRPLVQGLFNVFGLYQLEVILVNDASTDASEKVCAQIAEANPQVKFVSLRINAGEHNAVMCGLNYATGDYIAVIDDDLQNPPTEILTLLQTAIKFDYDVVYARYVIKQHSLFRNFCSRMNNFFAVYLLNKPKSLYLSSFKVMKRELVNEITKYRGPFPYIDALILRSTRNIGSEVVMHETRKDGRSNYTLRKLFSLYLNIFVNFSIKPLRFITISGLVISFLSFLMSISIVYEKFVNKGIAQGFSFLSILLLFSIGLTFVVIGLLGEYIGKILMSLNNAPQYVVKKECNTKGFEEVIHEQTYDRKAVRV